MTSAAHLQATSPATGLSELRPQVLADLDQQPSPAAPELFRSAGFWIVLAGKLLLGTLVASHYLRDLFAPFIDYFVASGFHNPWAHAWAQGTTDAFPYPPVMLYLMSTARALLAPFFAPQFFASGWAQFLIARLPIAAFDVLIAWILASWYPGRLTRVLRFYWYSPIVIYVCYWHGQLDLVPTALAMLSLHLLRRRKIAGAMVVLGLALGSKSHLWVCVPYLLVYIAGSRGVRAVVKPAAILLGSYLATLLPWIADPAFRSMVFFSPEQARIVANQISFGPNLSLLVAPGAIAFLWFRFAAYEKRNWDLLMLYLGILFSVFLLLAPPQPGYVLWTLPFVVHYFCRRTKVHLLPWVAFVVGYLGFVLLRADSDLFDAWKTVNASIAALPNPYHLLAAIDPAIAKLADNLAFTVMQTSLGGIVLYMYMMGVRGNIAYRMRTTPVMIGVAGDSGAGKDTMALLIAGMFEKRHSTILAGDDYHRWERGDEAWKRVTHLSAEGNRLYDQQDHALAMFMGETISKPVYDHDTGRFTAAQDVDPNHIMIFQGLHSLSTPQIRRLYDLSIFVDPAEELRYDWKLRRDCGERGHTEEQVLKSLESRREDRNRYILPQREYADFVVRWVPLALGEGGGGLVLEILALNSFNLTAFVEYLSHEPELVVDHTPYLDATQQRLRIRGKVSPRDLYRIKEVLFGGDIWLRNACTLSADLPGCLQLIIFICLREKLRWSGQPVWLD